MGITAAGMTRMSPDDANNAIAFAEANLTATDHGLPD